MRRYRERRAYAIEKLGGKCVVCGSTEDLELDHINKAEKSFNITQMWSVSKERYDAELAKCQLLCHTHHVEKSHREKDWGKGYGELDHGSASMYKNYGCRCDPCRKAYNAYTREYRQWKKLQEILDSPD